MANETKPIEEVEYDQLGGPVVRILVADFAPKTTEVPPGDSPEVSSPELPPIAEMPVAESLDTHALDTNAEPIT